MRFIGISFILFGIVGLISCNSSKTEQSKKSNAIHSMQVDNEESIEQFPKEFQEEFVRQLFKGFSETVWKHFCKELEITKNIEKVFFLNMDRTPGVNEADLITVTLINHKTSDMSVRSSSIENEGVGKLNYTYIETEIQSPIAIISIIRMDTNGIHSIDLVIRHDPDEGWKWPE